MSENAFSVAGVQSAKQMLRSLLPRAYLNWRDERFYARYGEVELHLLDLLCDRGRDSIDIGANEGCYVSLMRRLSRKVVAFEPLPWLADRLASRFGEDVEVRKVALSKQAGRTTLLVPIVDDVVVEGCATLDAQAASHYTRYKEIAVETARLDDVYGADAGFIKIDTEGHEEAVLEGAVRTIARSRPRLLVEIVDYLAPGGAARIAGFFEQLGYHGHFVYKRRVLPIETFDARIMQAKENEPDLTAALTMRERFPPFVYNFLFFPNEEPAATLTNLVARVERL